MFFTLSCVSLKTSSKKARSKSRSYHDSDYEPRIHASLAGVTEKKYMSLGGRQQEEMRVFCVLLSFICQQIIIKVSYTTLFDRANTNTSHVRRQSSSGSLSFQSLSVSCSSGWSNLLPRGCHLIIGQSETMARRIL